MKRLAVLGALFLLLTGFWHDEPYPAINLYFSSSTGNDGNPCSQAQPCATIAKANTFHYGAGSTINFLEGDSFDTSNTSNNGLILTGPASGAGIITTFGALTVSTYGGGTCAPIAGTITGCATINLATSSVSGMLIDTTNSVTISNIRVVGGASFISSYEQSWGFRILNISGANSGLTITNTETLDVSYGVGGTLSAGSLSNITLSNNYLHGSSPSVKTDWGIRLQGNIAGLLTGNLITNIGGASKTDPGYAPEGSGSGILVSTNGVTNAGFTIDYNVVHDIAQNANDCGGPYAIWSYQAIGTTVQFNEVYNIGANPKAAGTCDNGFYDIDGGDRLNTYQYNYGHNAIGPGILLYACNVGSNHWNNNTARYNIFEYATAGLTNSGTGIDVGGIGCGQDANVASSAYNNTYWTNFDNSNQVPPEDGWCLYGLVSVNVLLANNICVEAGALGETLFLDFYQTPAVVLVNNNYYRVNSSSFAQFNWNNIYYGTLSAFQTATGQDAGSTSINPALSAAGTGGTCWTSGIPVGPQPCPAGYVLNAGSTMIGTGLDLTKAPYSLNVGVKDYYGNTIPNGVGTGYNVGADGGNP